MTQRDVIPEWMRRAVLERDNYTCRYCGSKNGPFHMDHVYPVSRGGETSCANLVTACQRCNVTKNASVGIWPRPIDNGETQISDSRILGFVFVLFGIASATMVFSPVLKWSADNYVKATVLFGVIVISIGIYLFSK